MRTLEKGKGCDIGYALAISSCEGANSVEARTVTALDAITAFAVPSCGRGDLLDPVIPPEATHATEGWNAAFRTHSRSGENEDAVTAQDHDRGTVGPQRDHLPIVYEAVPVWFF